ncbi:endothelial differentiation-related factor 1 homolog [Notothenia coriiceps]|uniref:Endothelial differentiation-related factor 1 homolog n=1 Tax=Notothenia coriiceps TaxID=8208 RepID=A0A6I9NJH3_9TELE|nr:PREDICTED: endothelial differentiation-related factor 1 [Notothenia coriiceps]
MAESDWDTVTVLRKKGPSASQAKSKQQTVYNGWVLLAGGLTHFLIIYEKSSPQKINEKPQVIADYECGKAIPNNQVLGKIERAIGLKLRGKDIGLPLEPKTMKK